MALFAPTYFSPIAQYMQLATAHKIVFEVLDNFQKQTYRNRCYITGANGKQLLNIPVNHIANKKRTKDILVANNTWQQQHLKAIQTAYNNSPFFEFYQDDLIPIFTKKYTYLLDVNIDTFLFVMDALQLPNNFFKTTTFELQATNDFRFLANAKQLPNFNFHPYIQQFSNEIGFTPNLSILDLLFMEGPNAITYLEKKL